jgi:hypothetical protein
MEGLLQFLIQNGNISKHGVSTIGVSTVRVYCGRFRGGRPTGRVAFGHLLLLWTPHANRLCFVLEKRGRHISSAAEGEIVDDLFLFEVNSTIRRTRNKK